MSTKHDQAGHIRNVSFISAPVIYYLGTEQAKALQKIKKKLCPALSYFDHDPSRHQPVQFKFLAKRKASGRASSRGLLPSESLGRSCLHIHSYIVCPCQKFHQWLSNISCIDTDYKPLIWSSYIV